MHAQPVGQLGVAGREGEARQVGEALVGCPHQLHGAHRAPPLARRPGPGGLGGRERGAPATSPWSAPAWSASPWPTSWRASARASPWSTPRIRGGPPTPARASSRPPPAPRADPGPVALPAPGRRALPGAAGAPGRRRGRRRRGGLRRLRRPLPRPARPRGRVVRPVRRPGPAAVAGRGVRDHPRGGRVALPAARPGPPCRCTRPGPPGSTAGAWRPRCAQAAAARGVTFVAGRCTASSRGRPATRHVESVSVEGHRNVDCGALAVAGRRLDGGRGGVARLRPARWGRRRGRSCISASRRTTGGWPIVQPLLTHYLVPWPGGRVACGGTFEAGAGFSVAVTAAGLHELLRECLLVAPGPRAAPTYLETRGRAAAHLGRRPRPGGPAAGLGQRLGGHRPRRQRPAAGALLGPGAGARHGRRSRCPRDEPPLPGAFDPGPLRLSGRAGTGCDRIIHPTAAGRGETGDVLKGTLRQEGRDEPATHGGRAGGPGGHGLLLARPRRRSTATARCPSC